MDNMNNNFDNEVVSMNLFDALTNVLISPKSVFDSLKKKTHILIPLLIWALVGFIYIFAIKDIYEIDVRKIITEQLKSQNIDITKEIIEQRVVFAKNFAFISAPLSMIIAPLIKGLVCFVISRIFRGEGNAKENISVVSLSYFIISLGFIIKAILTLILGRTVSTINPVIFMGSMDELSKPLLIFSILDLSTIWYLIVSMIGIKIVNKLSLMESFVCTIVPYLLMLIPGILGILYQ